MPSQRCSRFSAARRTVICAAGAAAGAIALAGALAPRRALAATTTFEGVAFDERIRLAGHDLVLNGIGLRAAGWFKAYVAALYLPRPARSEAEVLAQGGAKRVRLVLLVDAPAVELAKGFDKGVLRNSGAAADSLRPRLARMFELMQSAGSVKKGDAVDLDFEPGRGTTLLLNGRARGEPIAGDDFYAAVLRSFVGHHPYHRKLKAGMLGLPLPP